MSKFEESRWADASFSQGYRDEADAFLPHRRQIIELAKSFYGHFIAANQEAAKVLDLGCGDGLFVQELLKSFRPAEVVLMDGSAEMLRAAKERLGEQENLNFRQASFQDLMGQKGPQKETFDFIYSSLAIHHLPTAEKKKLYTYIYNSLAPGGYFIHYEVVMPPAAELEQWYLSLWKQWIEEHSAPDNPTTLLVPQQYKDNSDNQPDPLDSQLEIMRDLGFLNVDCYFKYGIFTLFGGCR